MVLFEYRCERGEILERFFRLGQAPERVHCEDHGVVAYRRLSRVAWTAFPGSYRFEHRAS